MFLLIFLSIEFPSKLHLSVTDMRKYEKELQQIPQTTASIEETYLTGLISNIFMNLIYRETCSSNDHSSKFANK